MESEQMLSILKTLQKHINAGFGEAIGMIEENKSGALAADAVADIAEVIDRKHWDAAALEQPLPSGAFDQKRALKGISYRWADGNVDNYDDFVLYEGTDGLAGEQYAIGYKSNGEKIGFVIDGDVASRRGITFFQCADDFAATSEVISFMRGSGKTGKAGFGPGDPVPLAYQPFDVEPLAGRVFGKWNRLGVVAKSDDAPTILAHTALQARLRRIA